MGIVIAGIRAGIAGDSPKAIQLVETSKSKVAPPPSINISTAEACEIINSMRYHAVHLAFDIKRLANSLVVENSKDQIVEDLSIDSFIAGFRLAWKLSQELNMYDREHPISTSDFVE